MLRFVLIASSLLFVSAMRKVGTSGAEALTGPPLCDESIVQETCKTLNSGDDSSSVTLEALQDTLTATGASARKFWAALNFEEGQSVPCTDLCQGTLTALQHFGATVPGSSDVGCYVDDSGTVCDLPLDFGSIKAITKTNTDIPFMPEVKQPPVIQEKRSFKKKGGAATPKEELSIDYPVWEAARRVANLFRIYPLDETIVTDNSEGDSMLEEESTEVIDVTLVQGFDGKWGLTLFPNPSTTVMKVVPHGAADKAGVKVNDVIMRDPTQLRNELKRGRPLRLSIRREGRSGGSSLPVRPSGGGGLPGRPSGGGGGSSTPKWRRDLAQRNQQAQVYVTNALHKLRSHQTQNNIDKWFGRGSFTNDERRRELTRVLNSVDAMLDNVEYVFPGPECKPNVYAYVYPRHPDASKVRDRSGKLIFYLCQLYVDSPTSVQIETLTHEGSHHASAFTTDVCADAMTGRGYRWPTQNEESRSSWPDNLEIGEYYDQTVRGRRKTVQIVRITPTKVITEDADFDHECDLVAYGRDTCQDLARANPFQAMRNADNLCYYIQDVTDDS